jgi:hypothetical protein
MKGDVLDEMDCTYLSGVEVCKKKSGSVRRKHVSSRCVLASSHGPTLDRDFRHTFLAVAIDDSAHHSPSRCILVHSGLLAMFACDVNGVY